MKQAWNFFVPRPIYWIDEFVEEGSKVLRNVASGSFQIGFQFRPPGCPENPLDVPADNELHLFPTRKEDENIAYGNMNGFAILRNLVFGPNVDSY
jgi:hypothetical protein